MKKLILISAIALSALMTSAQTPSVSTRPAPVGGVNTHVIESNISVAATRIQKSQELKGQTMIPTMFFAKRMWIQMMVLRIRFMPMFSIVKPGDNK